MAKDKGTPRTVKRPPAKKAAPKGGKAAKSGKAK